MKVQLALLFLILQNDTMLNRNSAKVIKGKDYFLSPTLFGMKWMKYAQCTGKVDIWFHCGFSCHHPFSGNKISTGVEGYKSDKSD